jgi:hypothetical protein
MKLLPFMKVIEQLSFIIVMSIAIIVGTGFSHIYYYMHIKGMMFWAFASGLSISLIGYPFFKVLVIAYVDKLEENKKEKELKNI